MSMEVRESDFQPPPAPSLGVHGGELAALTRRLEVQLASIDSKLDHLLQEAVKSTSGPMVEAESASSKGWLAVSASGGCTPRWSEGPDTSHQGPDIAEHGSIIDRNKPSPISHKVDHLAVVREENSQENEMSNIASSPVLNSEVQETATSPIFISEVQETADSTKTKSSSPSLASFHNRSSVSTPRLSDRVMTFMSQTSRRRPRWKEKIWLFLEDPDISTGGYIYERFIRIVIVTSLITTLLQTLQNPPMSHKVSAIVESTFEIYFLLEVFARFLASPNYKAFWQHVYNWIDLVSGAFIILRASLDFVIPNPKDCHLRCSLLVGFCPVVRILKMLRRMHQFQLLYRAFIQAYQALQPLLSIFCILLLVFTAVIWVVEPRSNLADFPAAVWFIFVSMTTVGYGDVTPDSAGGKVIVAVSVVSGFLYMGIPVGIIGNAFNDVWKDRDRLLVLSRARDRVKGAGYRPSELPAFFHMFDSDKNGQLDAAEFCWMMQGLKLGLTQERRRELFEAFDADDSGGVSSKEFVRALFPESVEDVFGVDVDSRTKNTHTFSSLSSSVNSAGFPLKMLQAMKKNKRSMRASARTRSGEACVTQDAA